MSLPSGDPSMVRGQELRVWSAYTQLLESLLQLEKAIKDRVDLLIQPQRPVSTEEQDTNLGRLMRRVTTLLQSGETSRPPAASPHTPRAVGAHAQDQLQHPPGPLRVTYVSSELSNRGNDIMTLLNFSFQDFMSFLGDKFHKDENPLGFINLGVCENKLCSDLVTKRLSQKDMDLIEDTLLQYPDRRGHPFLRKEVAWFLTHYCNSHAPLDPENVVVLNGSSAVFSALVTVLCDPGEAILTPTPFYGPFALTASLYTKVHLIPVHLDSEVSEENPRPFQLTVDKLEQALWDAQLKGKKVKGFLLINPQNPLGDVYSRDSLQEFLEFAKRNNLHMIVDERYLLSVFDESVTFHSVLSLRRLPDLSRTHVIWSTSKDFGIAGFRFGALYTHSKELAAAVGSLGFLHGLSGITQYKLSRLLQDREWINRVFLPTSHNRLQAAHKYTTICLQGLGIPFLKRGSGLSIWINLRKYLNPCTFDQELCLHRRFLDHKVILCPGKACMCSEPGWFCLVFAEKLPQLEQGLFRLQQALLEQEQELTERLVANTMRE
ncbi:probable inactive 1-aminocyclopropane-1-carboxylate synthase-like protein 2 [Sorex fumeus]|uniref:probable inactive 1-aminocyclopropane-1-carboxylate synthase-like protein 2 n=1 Tax=Sorex fumeus TaxID=62283 RepID=UPI0024AC94F1|nr:probable inactive 1-aminocyclopropane-1-carboxylate synthase-like protein 2 [Sorex fumeus]